MDPEKCVNAAEAMDPAPEDAGTEAPEPQRGMTRRQALSVAAGAVAGTALAGCQPSTPPSPETSAAPGVAPLRVPDLVSGSERTIRAERFEDAPALRSFASRFAMPPVRRAGADKAIHKDIEVRPSDLKIRQKHPDTGNMVHRLVSARTYNGQVPGETLEVDPGGLLDLTVFNQLGPNDPPAPEPYNEETCQQLMEWDVPHCFNTTNLHTHGLHVSPESTEDGVASDDITIKIEPGESQRYRIQLPDFHAPGTHWYHAHVHGSTGLQVANGLAGALIVRETDQVLIDAVDSDLVWMIQEIVDRPDGFNGIYANVKTPDGREPKFPFGKGKPVVPLTVNALDSAVLEMTTGEMHRWRLINATGTPRGFMNVSLREKGSGDAPGNIYSGEKKGLHLMAEDGITFYGESAEQVDEHFMAPGNRADFLVQIPEPGVYELWKTKYPVRSDGKTGATSDQLLVTINVSGDPQTPRDLPPLPELDPKMCYLEPIESATVRPDPIVFAVPSRGVFGGFLVGAGGEEPAAYGTGPPAVRVNYHAVEEWTLQNTSDAAHPFHIHVNPFQVLLNPEETDESKRKWRWHDVISVPAQEGDKPGEVTIRHRFLTYSGKFVIHCHVLIHEDCGMMRDVVVSDGGAEPGEIVEVCVLP